MSLQSDFELCLEYAEALEFQRDRQVQAQNNIIFMQKEGERLKNKLRICTILSAVSAAIVLVVALQLFVGKVIDAMEDLVPLVIVMIVVFAVSFANRFKTKKELQEFESQKPVLIRKYMEDADESENEVHRLIEEIDRENLLDIVPADYFSVAAIEFGLNQVRKKIANTATEAFRQLEAEIQHLEQMEYLQQMNDARIAQLNDVKRAIEINTLVTLVNQNQNNS